MRGPIALLALGAAALGCAGAPQAPRAARTAAHDPMTLPTPAVRPPRATTTDRAKVVPDADGPPSARDLDPEESVTHVDASSARCPAEMSLVDDRICVDRWEASLVECVVTAGATERTWSPFHAIDGREQLVRAVSRPGAIPQGYVSGKQAQVACRASGKRLCTADEWERACRGSAHNAFPYGAVRRAGACNDDVRARHPVVEAAVQVGLAPERWWREGMNVPLVNQLPDSLLRTGERNECVSEWGIYDIVGNLHEWIDDPDGTFRGGFYMDTAQNGEGCAYRTTAHDFAYHDYSTGFRCCMDPERIE